MISIVELKIGVTGANIIGIIISKFRHEKELYSIILLKVNLKIDFYCTILPLSLAVYLCGESGR